jgi:hypothetical protein
MAALKWGSGLWNQLQGYGWDDAGCFLDGESNRGWLKVNGDYWSLDWEPPDPPDPPNYAFPIYEWNTIKGGALQRDQMTVVKDGSWITVPIERPTKKADVQAS